MLTIVGELAMGWLDQAADRAERLCDRLVAEGVSAAAAGISRALRHGPAGAAAAGSTAIRR
jgi:hypothetical protein